MTNSTSNDASATAIAASMMSSRKSPIVIRKPGRRHHTIPLRRPSLAPFSPCDISATPAADRSSLRSDQPWERHLLLACHSPISIRVTRCSAAYRHVRQRIGYRLAEYLTPYGIIHGILALPVIHAPPEITAAVRCAMTILCFRRNVDAAD